MTNIVYATSNPGKLAEVQKLAEHEGLIIKSLADFGIDQEVEESGDTLEANAKIKAEFYQNLLPSGTIVIADDTGVEIDALGGEPGIKVRRWKGYKMADEEIIEYCLHRLKDVPEGQRSAQFRTVLAVVRGEHDVQYFDGVLKGEILTVPRAMRREGMPFWPIFYIPRLKMTLGEFHESPIDFCLRNPTHRELAFLKAITYLSTLNH